MYTERTWIDFYLLDRVAGIVETTSKTPSAHWHSERDRHQITVAYSYQVAGNAYKGRRRSFDLRDGFDRLVVGDSIDVYVDAATPDQSRLRPAWKGSNLLSLGYAFMMLIPAMFLAMSFEPARRVLEHILGADGVPWRWGICALGLFFVLTALSVRSEQVPAVLMMDRAETTLIDRQRDVLSPHVAFTTITDHYTYRGVRHEGTFRTGDRGALVYADHPPEGQIRIYVDEQDPRISVAYLESGAVILSCVLLSLGVLIMLFSYPVSWRLVGMVIQRVLDRRIARDRTQSAIP